MLSFHLGRFVCVCAVLSHDEYYVYVPFGRKWDRATAGPSFFIKVILVVGEPGSRLHYSDTQTLATILHVDDSARRLLFAANLATMWQAAQQK
jgi:hypothetical protein